MFDHYFLMKPSAVRRYAVKVLEAFRPDEPVECVEIGDGNINYVFRVRSLVDGHSVIVKQADRLLRSSGRPLDPHRSAIEAENLRLKGELVPGYLPKLIRYDDTMSAIVMEDVSAYRNLRKELLAGHVFPHLAEQLSDFLVRSLLPTTDLVLDRQEKKRRVQFFTNPELCDITEDLVLTEPYDDYKHRNILTPGNESFVEERLYHNMALHGKVACLRDRFMNCAQALLHGDLHTGSIFVNETGVKVIDLEFGFYGPMGYDIGNVIANLIFAWTNRYYIAPGTTEDAIADTLRSLCTLTWRKLAALYDDMVTFPLYQTPSFRDSCLASIRSDSLAYAGTELIRRVVGDTKVEDITSVTDPAQRVPMERFLIETGIQLIDEGSSKY